MERLTNTRPSGFDRNAMRLWGLIFAAVGMLGKGIVQNRVLGMATNPGGLIGLLDSSDAMNAATAAIIMQIVEGMAVPVFAVLTLDGFRRTSGFRKYLIRMGLLAAVSEIPYNFALTGRLLDNTSRNPVFGMVLALVMLYLISRYGGKTPGGILVGAAVFLAALAWAFIFRVDYGVAMVVLCGVLWLFRDRHTLSFFAGSAAALCCTVGNPLFMFSPFGFLLAHFYNGEEGRSVRFLQYALYPILLLLIGAVGFLMF